MQGDKSQHNGLISGLLTFICDAEVGVDQLVELLAELDVHLFSVVCKSLLLKHGLDTG